MLRRKILAERKALRQGNVGAKVRPRLEGDLNLAVFEAERGEHQPAREHQTGSQPNKIPILMSRRSSGVIINVLTRPTARSEYHSGEQHKKDEVPRDQRLA